MYFRQLLNDETACASYLLGCATYSQFAVVDPHVDLVDEYIARAQAQDVPIVAVFDTHVQADHVSGMPEGSSRAPARARTCPPAPASSSTHHPLADGRGRHAREHGDPGDLDARPRARAPRLPRHRPPPRRGAVAGTDRRCAARRGRRPSGSARARRAHRRAPRAELYRSLTDELIDAPRSSRPLPLALLRVGLRPGSVGQPDLDDRVRAPPQLRPAVRLRGRVRAGADRDIPPAPEQQAAIVAANRSGRPLVAIA